MQNEIKRANLSANELETEIYTKNDELNQLKTQFNQLKEQESEVDVQIK